ncbi:MAG TPA: TMEM14 family protein [Methylomirabilota bacterium]|nr:TMEM14 family protein [Methylomirabilota bacterium]
MQDTVLWIYIVLLVAGGLMGYLKAKSKASVLTSTAFAALLSLCALRIITMRHATEFLLLFLLAFFALRFAKSRKFMPMGMMALLTVITLAMRQLL